MPIVFEQLLDVPKNAVWEALTNKEEMKQWYFDLEKFEAVPGFDFSFNGGPENGPQYLHLCEVTRVVPFETLVYSWRYEGYAGISHVHFELEERGNQTLLRLTHTGLESFPQENKDFAEANFAAGWEEIIGNALPRYLNNRHTS